MIIRHLTNMSMENPGSISWTRTDHDRGCIFDFLDPAQFCCYQYPFTMFTRFMFNIEVARNLERPYYGNWTSVIRFQRQQTTHNKSFVFFRPFGEMVNLGLRTWPPIAPNTSAQRHKYGFKCGVVRYVWRHTAVHRSVIGIGDAPEFKLNFPSTKDVYIYKVNKDGNQSRMEWSNV